jgi:hypothetical protein
MEEGLHCQRGRLDTAERFVAQKPTVSNPPNAAVCKSQDIWNESGPLILQ